MRALKIFLLVSSLAWVGCGEDDPATDYCAMFCDVMVECQYWDAQDLATCYDDCSTYSPPPTQRALGTCYEAEYAAHGCTDESDPVISHEFEVCYCGELPEDCEATCGDGSTDGTEWCDGGVDFGCEELGYSGGVISCNDDCTLDESQCIP